DTERGSPPDSHAAIASSVSSGTPATAAPSLAAHSGRERSRSAPTPALWPSTVASRCIRSRACTSGAAAAAAVVPAPSERIPTAAMIRLRLAGKGEPPPLAAPFCPRRRVAWQGPPCPLGPRSPREASRGGGFYV